MKSLIQFTAVVLFFGGLVFSSRAGFSSIYIFGDSLSATATNNATGSTTKYFYGKILRYTNGRTWVEVLAQRQGLGANSISNTNWDYSSNNLSYYYHSSSNVVADVNSFIPPANATNCLFVVWVDNADIVDDMLIGDPITGLNNGTNLAYWTAAINQHLTNHFNIITNLYAKGCRTLIVPNAADVTTIPQFNQSSVAYLAFVRQRIVSFNTNFAAMLKQVSTNANYGGLKICAPDIFSLLNNVLTNAATYGLTNALSGGFSIDAIDDLNPSVLNGPGTNYIFWDPQGDPTAQMSEVIADTVQQNLSPVKFSGITPVNTSNRLDVVNMPLGLNGLVLFSTNLAQANWLTNSSFNSLTNPQSIFVSPTNSARFYRLQFPWQWTWP